MSERELLILLTNDDGADAPGLRSLREALDPLGRVFVVAPLEERSAVSHALTIHHPIRIIELGSDDYALTGNPADCVIFAVQKLLPRMPDLVISGINHGANLGDDVLYSGTVAGAREAAIQQIPAMALSLVTNNNRVPDFSPAARFARRLVDDLFPSVFASGIFLNVNFPEGELSDYRFTRQGSKLALNSIEEKQDPRGRKYYWLGLDESRWVVEADTDYQAIGEQLVSITPLQRDQTDIQTLRRLSERISTRTT